VVNLPQHSATPVVTSVEEGEKPIVILARVVIQFRHLAKLTLEEIARLDELIKIEQQAGRLATQKSGLNRFIDRRSNDGTSMKTLSDYGLTKKGSKNGIKKSCPQKPHPFCIYH
jgi:hypothetical protein